MLLDFFISTVVFFVTAWWLRRYFEEQGISAGFTRGVMVFVIASAASFAASSLVSWMTGEPSSDQQMVQMAHDMAQHP